MRVITLKTRTNQRAFVIVVVLISKIPIQPRVNPNREPTLGRLETHRVGAYQGAWGSSRIRKTTALPVILIDSVGRIKSYPRPELRRRIDEKEIVPHEVQAVPDGMADTGGGRDLEEIVDDRVAVYPIVVITCAERESGSRDPINRGSERP